jgi:hypothetical protein
MSGLSAVTASTMISLMGCGGQGQTSHGSVEKERKNIAVSKIAERPVRKL